MNITLKSMINTVQILSTKDIIVARQQGRELAQNYGFSKGDQIRFATAISELTRNIITYAVQGRCEFYTSENEQEHIILAKIIDHGPGIDNPLLAITDGYSSGSGLGLGLSGAKRLVHEFLIESTPGLTTIEINIKKRKY
jgi:serine/threonine-protein kinase RsbT